MEIGPNGSACLIDLTISVRTELENFVYQKNTTFFLNPTGNKLLYFVADREAEVMGITHFGAIALEENTFIAFDWNG